MTVALPTASEITAALIAREELPPEKGDIGPQGLQGPDGQFGPPGPQGPKGDPGRDGVDGAPGDLGPVGPQGKQGDRGLKGDKGDKGDEGDRGEQGPIGPTGASGSGRSFFPRGGGSSSGSGLPSGGTVGQVVTNTAPGAGDWEDAAGALPAWFMSGSGAPPDSVTPSQQGAVYADTTNGALYVAIGPTSADWIQVAGNNPTSVPSGVNSNAGGTTVIAPKGHSVVVTDVLADLGGGNSFTWFGSGVDGSQSAAIETGLQDQKFRARWGVDGTFSLTRVNTDRFTVNPAGTVIVTPTAVAATLYGLAGGENYVAQTPGAAGNNITIEYVDPGAPNEALSADVLGDVVTVHLATDGAGAITSTSAQVVAAVNGTFSGLVTAAGGGPTVVAADAPESFFGGLDAPGPLILHNTPTADPAVAGQVWADDGVLVLSGSIAGGGSGSFLSIAKWS